MKTFITRATAESKAVTAATSAKNSFESIALAIKTGLKGVYKVVPNRNGASSSVLILGPSGNFGKPELARLSTLLKTLEFFDEDAYQELKVEIPNGPDSATKSKDLYCLLWTDESAQGSYVEVKASSNLGIVVINLFEE